MGFGELMLLAVGLSMDTFAVPIRKGSAIFSAANWGTKRDGRRHYPDSSGRENLD